MRLDAALPLAFALALGSRGVHAQERTLVKTATVKAPVDEVWNAWTTTEGIQSFFAPEAEGLSGVERYRVLVAGRTHDGAVWLVVAQVPEALAGAVTPAVIEMLWSAAPAAPPPPASGTGAGG